jgi:UDP-N-acetylmuramoyl-L-alanyl-D-glutamate--2,6-diaminopimelate ligase
MAPRLQELVSGLDPIRVEGLLDREVTGIASDSRRVFPGMVFVALRGRRCDGHDHISAAIDRGACAVVCERNGFTPRRATSIRVADSRLALARVAAVFYGQPSRKLRVVGVTGTNGKTTVGFLLQHILECSKLRTGLIGTVHYEVGDRTIPAQRTTPESAELQAMMAQMVRARCGACVLEVSSHGLDQRRVEGVEFDVGVFTNLTHDHLDYHGSPEGYHRTKRRLFELLEQGAKPGTAVINHDDAAGCRMLREWKGARCLTYGLGESAGVAAVDVKLGPGGAGFGLVTGGDRWDCSLPLIGRFNVYNALAAAAAGLALEVPPAVVVDALSTAPQVPGRLERIDAGQPFTVLVDYAHTEDALRNVLSALREVTPGRVRVAFGCGGGRDPAKRESMGRAAGELADEVILTSDNPRQEDPGLIAAAIERGLREASGAHWRVELDRARAIEALVRVAGAGDTVLVAGKGHESYQEFEDTVVPFDDRLHAARALELLGHTRCRTG